MFRLQPIIFVIGLLICMGLQSHIYAQETNLADSTRLIKEVLIKSTTVGKESAVPHYDLSSEEIKKMAEVRDIPYLLSSIPSVVETSDGGTGVGYTGMRLRGSDPTRVNITLNGIPYNDAESQGVFWVNMPDVAGSVQEIQVQRGVGSSTNGAGSFGGSVHLDLSRVSQQPEASVSLTGGSFGTFKASVAAQSGIRPSGLYIAGRASGVQSQGYIDRASADLLGFHVHGGKIGERHTIAFHVLHGMERTYQAWNGLPQQYLEIDALRTFNTAGTEKPDAPYADEVDDYKQTHVMAHLKYQLPKDLFLQVNGHYTRGLGFYEQYKAGALLADYQPEQFVDATSDLVRRLWLDNHFYGTTWSLSRNKGTSELLYGGGLNQYIGKHYGTFATVEGSDSTASGLYYENDASKIDFNHFAKITHQFSTSWSAYLDLQHRYVQYAFTGFDRSGQTLDDVAKLHFFNPKLGLVYQINTKLAGYLFGGVAQREPNRSDYTNSSPDSRPKAERLYNIEAGIRKKSGKWIGQINGFLMYYQNQLVLNGRINDVGAFVRSNVAKSYRMGLEAEANAQLTERFKLSANIALSENKVLDYTEYIDDWDTSEKNEWNAAKSTLAFSPSLISWLGLDYGVLLKQNYDFHSNLTVKYVSSQFLDNTENPFTQLDGYAVTDLKLRLRLKKLLGKEVLIVGSVQNLFDARYVSNGWTYRFRSAGYNPVPDDPYAASEGGNAYNLTGLFPQAGRNYLLSVQVVIGD